MPPQGPATPIDLDSPLKSQWDDERQLQNWAVRSAIDNYETLADLHRSFPVTDESPDERSYAVGTLISRAFSDAEQHLLRLILSFDPNIRPRDFFDSPKMACRPQGVRFGDKVFMAMPDRDCVLDPDRYDYSQDKNWKVDRMTLHFIDLQDVAEVGHAWEPRS